MSVTIPLTGVAMTQKFDHFFDIYERIVPSWFMDVFAGVALFGFVGWVVALIV